MLAGIFDHSLSRPSDLANPVIQFSLHSAPESRRAAPTGAALLDGTQL